MSDPQAAPQRLTAEQLTAIKRYMIGFSRNDSLGQLHDEAIRLFRHIDACALTAPVRLGAGVEECLRDLKIARDLSNNVETKDRFFKAFGVIKALTARVAELEGERDAIRNELHWWLHTSQDGAGIRDLKGQTERAESRAQEAERRLESARSDALEEAAQLCDEKRADATTYDAAHAYSLAAVDIRALKPRPDAGEQKPTTDEER